MIHRTGRNPHFPRLYPALAVMLLTITGAFAIHQGANDLPWSQAMSHPLDQPLNDQYDGKCFFMNLGPTGIRARIDPDEPRTLKVMYVFQDANSPARGKIKIGDKITGVNHRAFQDDHGFHRSQGGRGWPGPPYELALAIEDAQGKDGKLDLLVKSGGTEAPGTVSLQLKPVGRFADSWPWRCRRSDQLRKDLVDFMFENGIQGRHHMQVQCLLALWASDDPRAMPLVEEMAEKLKSAQADPENGTGFPTWNWGYTGIFLGEYYHTTKDKGVLPAVQSLVSQYERGQDWRSGGYSHKPFPYIQRRIADGGPKGYGAMAAPGGLAMLAQSTFKANALPYSARAYERTHQAFLKTAGGNKDGSIAYGFSPWTHAVIDLADGNKAKSGKGIGYVVPDGMKGIGDYTLVWPTKADPRWKPTDWIKDEADQNTVTERAANSRMVIRTMIEAEPSAPYKTGPGGGGHIAPVGMGALAHAIGNKNNKSWNYLGDHMATCCANSAKTLWDGHACAEMHAFFGVLGAARAEEKAFRAFLDYTKTWVILSETHDGGLVEQPFGCQRNSTCSIERNRQSYTSVAVLLLSLPKRKLLITGADDASPASLVPVLREARTLNAEKRAMLQKGLQRMLVNLDKAELFKPVPINISKSPTKVWLADVDEDGTLTFEQMEGEARASCKLSDLTGRDQGRLAALVTHLKPEAKDAFAMTGVYLEALGLVPAAEEYYKKAGEESRAKLERLFEEP